ncbi:hypothetical protein MKS88_001282 [Plasmodium brasilianum]|uniref:CRA domain-containing protein n=2 Tax=Plasmodium (Plasmodium) TaxID=418103 RepID=A0A1A8WKF7_PLAMA|nr:conserved Plasmodium protein, unknown function [Plasmodium malariae]KAI4839930.1 hypothetical protein MKS88_001282 [Plasmodium brasilianum]SBS93397.1 conserved Plasmodium protein, unknown function [Plasmodium malariae]SBT74826.1 conserved Plasmodium protein, unknown function [Plasmodium malariae]SBT87300.1 conserved Plasmodium protein, unknown function [Plasmodium malariae]
MKYKVSVLYVITVFLLIAFSDVIKGDNSNNDNKKKDMWKSRFSLGKGTQKTDGDANEKNDKNHDKEKKEKEFLMNNLKGADMNDPRSVMLLKEIYDKDNQLSIISRKKKKYKTATFTLGTLLTIIAIRTLTEFAVKSIAKFFQKEGGALGGLILDKWNLNNLKKEAAFIETLV